MEKKTDDLTRAQGWKLLRRSRDALKRLTQDPPRKNCYCEGSIKPCFQHGEAVELLKDIDRILKRRKRA